MKEKIKRFLNENLQRLQLQLLHVNCLIQAAAFAHQATEPCLPMPQRTQLTLMIFSYTCGVFLILSQSALTPNKFRTAGSQRKKGSFFQWSDSNPGWLCGKRDRYLCAMPSPI